ncbi:MAG: TldD/PmbA family protein [Alphaproteobacteria bacterium]|nr:TldD/PmbA family protein [Alphaproteobacteria bacterium]
MPSSDNLNLLNDIISMAKQKGADSADVMLAEGTSVTATCRMGALEMLERSEGGDIGLRVFVGKRQAIVSSSDRSKAAFEKLADTAVAMAKSLPEDPYCGIASPDEIATEFKYLDMCDDYEPSAKELVNAAMKAEEAALSVDGISNSDGADADWGRTQISIASSNGYSRSYSRTGSSVSVSVLAQNKTSDGDSNGSMERDYDYTTAVYWSDLRSSEAVGKKAAERTLTRLGAKKVPSASGVPVVLAPRVARGFLGHFTGAINGASIARGTSFLKDSLGKEIFAPNINIIEDPHLMRGLASKPCDAEGIANAKRNLIENGELTTWLLDLRSARQLGMTSTGHASRGISSPPSPSSTNVHIEAGSITPDEMIAGINSGLYVTELFGQGVNGITGDYSRGAVGFWIENGKIAYPVSEITVAGNLKDMFKNMSAANDLEFISAKNSPTLLIENMTIAGS